MNISSMVMIAYCIFATCVAVALAVMAIRAIRRRKAEAGFCAGMCLVLLGLVVLMLRLLYWQFNVLSMQVCVLLLTVGIAIAFVGVVTEITSKCKRI